MDISKLDDRQLAQLVENRFNSSESVWSVIKKVYDRNAAYYDCEMEDEKKMPDYLRKVPVKKHRVKSNRIFRNVESVINALIASLLKINIIPGRNTPEAVELAGLQEQYFINKYNERNVKETVRKGLRNLYLGRLIVIKPFWNAKINDFDAVSVDPRKVRFAKNATKEEDSEFAIEEVDDTLESLVAKFPAKKEEIMKLAGYTDATMMTENPSVTYKEAWIKDWVIFKYQNVILGKIRNPYWDWDGLMVTQDEEIEMEKMGQGERKTKLGELASMQEERLRMMAPDQNGEMPIGVNQTQPITFNAYRYNHFQTPRKPYIFATVLNNEACPIGRTDFISQAIPLQESVDRRKRQIDDAAEMAGGITKVDSSVMDKSDAQKLRYESTAVIYGKGVREGVTREFGGNLPQFVYEDMVDSRQEIDNIMAASSAFRGEREGRETKAGRLALIEQSFMALNELVQVIDYVNQELFNWFYQLAKLRYTETHYAKTMGVDKAVRTIELMQDDFMDGTEVRVIPGKTLPEDAQFKYERAQNDVINGIISPVDYLREAGYQNPMDTAKNAVLYKMNPASAVGISPELQQTMTPVAPPMPEQVPTPPPNA